MPVHKVYFWGGALHEQTAEVESRWRIPDGVIQHDGWWYLLTIDEPRDGARRYVPYDAQPGPCIWCRREQYPAGSSSCSCLQPCADEFCRADRAEPTPPTR